MRWAISRSGGGCRMCKSKRAVCKRLGLVALFLSVGGLLTLISTCGQQYALLLTIRGKSSNVVMDVFDLRVKNLASGETILERKGQQVDASNPNRDISVAGQELKIAVEFAEEGNYLVYLLAKSGAGIESSQFILRDFQVDGVLSHTLELSILTGDKDGDGYPACGPPEGIECPPVSCKYLDCDDGDPSIHPFAAEVCENGKDDDCSAGCGADPKVGDEKCVDADGDGIPEGQDCDDNDPCRSPKIVEAKNRCGLTDNDFDNQWTAACKKKLAEEEQPFSSPFCGDGLDQDCNGKDVACFIDEDCDNFSPPQDCNDKDEKINPQVPEICDGKDNNCNNLVDEGCLPCDVDGDHHARVGYQGTQCDYPKDDPDDYDSGINPQTTEDTDNSEGGSVKGALREFCSYKKDKNGIPQRAVDHDGDKILAQDDGCPSEDCDKDGDGFAGPQCSPPKSHEDCDDNDPHTFPGAPDLCGDKKAQNCLTDNDCSCDQDGDGYCPPADCDDSAAKGGDVHPWAVEKCDRIDNDCDGLVDEGNPDAQGVLISTNKRLCNDDNDGLCAPACSPGSADCSSSGRMLSGVCACSPVDTREIYHHDEGDSRVVCQGESFSAPSSPRCFEATQPSLETCAKEDRDCDGHDFVSGQNFVDKGKACGLSIGTCTVGTVDDCNLNASVPNAALVKQVMKEKGAEFNEFWVCQGAALPVPEACDGKDDDCNGSLMSDEKDGDSDGFLLCKGCSQGSGRTDLLSSFKGCSDCNDGAKTIFPGAPEQCNHTDDNCANGISDDGKDECTGNVTCCSSQGACRNLSSGDVNNCGTCGYKCPTDVANTCAGGKCVCGSSGSACTNGLNCVNGSCQCITNGLCGGCCSGNTCQSGTSTSACGKGGALCATCTTSAECNVPVCRSDGTCGSSPASGNPPCPGGICYNGACCKECWSGVNCVSGTHDAACGTGGKLCVKCTPSGKCRDYSCCNGCWDGSSCQSGTAVDACGSQGDLCLSCTSSDPCRLPVCKDNACSTDPAGVTVPCSGGVCVDGTCCQGCYASGQCYDGDTSLFCGTGGVLCKFCIADNTCDQADCSTKTCVHTQIPNGDPCTDNSGTCQDGVCVPP